MRSKAIIAVMLMLMVLLTSCTQQSPTSGIGDIEPPHLATESELVRHLRGAAEYYYKPVTVPEALEFAYIRPQHIYIGWYYSYPDAVAKHPYFDWTNAPNGHEVLVYDIENEGLMRLGETEYYYSIVPQPDDFPEMKDICAVVWVFDDYIFRLNIPGEYAIRDNLPDIELIEKYTQLVKVEIQP